MAIVNRDLDSSLQKLVVNCNWGGALTACVGTGATLVAHVVPFPSTLKAVEASIMGISGSPVVNIEVHRMTSGGYTQIAGGMTNLALQVIGTSGPQAGVLAAAGSSFLALTTNDVLVVKTSGANSAVNYLNVQFVLQSLQDVTTFYGV